MVLERLFLITRSWCYEETGKLTPEGLVLINALVEKLQSMYSFDPRTGMLFTAYDDEMSIESGMAIVQKINFIQTKETSLDGPHFSRNDAFNLLRSYSDVLPVIIVIAGPEMVEKMAKDFSRCLLGLPDGRFPQRKLHSSEGYMLNCDMLPDTNVVTVIGREHLVLPPKFGQKV
jgi:hypothetical protein